MTPESTRRWIKRLRQERKSPRQTSPMSVQHRRKSPKAKIRQRLTAAEAEVVTACAATADPMATRQPPRHPKAPRAIPPHHHGKASKAMGPPIRRPTKPKATPPLRHGKAPRAMPLHRHGKAPRAIHPHRHCEAPKAIHRHRHCEAPKATWQSPHPRPSSPTCCPWNTSTASRRTVLQWVNSDAEKIAAAQAAIAAEPKPVHVPREPKPPVVIDEGPLILVETRKDLSQVKLPFEA